MSNANLKWDVPTPYIEERVVVEDEIDGFNHVNNLIYLKWCNEVAWAHSKQLGLNFGDYQRLGVGLVVRHHSLNYLASAKLGDRVALGTWIAKNDHKLRVFRNYQLFDTETGKLLMTGFTEFVAIDMISQRPKRMPDEFKEKYIPAL